MEDEALKAHEKKRLTVWHWLIPALCIVLGVALLVVVNTPRFLIIFLMLFAVWGISRSKLSLKVIATAAIIYFGIGIVTIELNSHTLWKYPFQRAYIGLYQNIKEPEWFPDFEGDVKGEYEFDYMPSVMQGTGHYSVYFETDEETLRRYENEFSSKAEYTFTLEEYYSAENVFDRAVEIPDIDSKNSTEKSAAGRISLFLGKRYDGQASSNVTVYVLDSNLDFNHPHTSAVFIDKDNNAVFLSRLG